MYYRQTSLLKDFENIDLSNRKISIRNCENQEKVTQFLKQWYSLSQDIKDQAQYAFNILFNARVQTINNFITFTNQQQSQSTFYTEINKQSQLIEQSQQYFIRSFGNTHIIKIDNELIAINPTKSIVKEHISKIILTNSSLSNISACLDLMISFNKSIVIVTTQQIYLKILKLCQFLFGNLKYTELFPCMIMQVGIHFYKISGLLMLFRRNMWYEYTYDLLLNHDGKIYLFQEKCIRQQKIIYPAWKKQIISEQRYLQLLFSPQKYYWRSSTSEKMNERIQLTPIKLIKPTLLQFLRQVPLFYFLEDEEIILLSEMLQEETYLKNSIICKEGMFIDKVYLVYSGYVVKSINNKKLQQKQSFGYQEWLLNYKKQHPRAISTYSTQKSPVIILSIHIKMLNYFLYRHIPKMIQMFKHSKLIPPQLQTILKETILDQWQKGWIYYNCKQAEKVQQFRLKQKTILSLGNLQLFLQEKMWYQFCRKNLQILTVQRQVKII